MFSIFLKVKNNINSLSGYHIYIISKVSERLLLNFRTCYVTNVTQIESLMLKILLVSN